jgi:hypothetical protein
MSSTVSPSENITVQLPRWNSTRGADTHVEQHSVWSRITALNITGCVAAVLLVLFLTVGSLAVDGDSKVRPIVVVVGLLTLLAFNAVALALGREYLDRRSRVIERRLAETFAAELVAQRKIFEDDLNTGRLMLRQGFVDIRTQVALLRAEIGAQIATLPGRIESYADTRVTDFKADTFLAAARATGTDGDAAAPADPPRLTMVRQSGSRD